MQRSWPARSLLFLALTALLTTGCAPKAPSAAPAPASPKAEAAPDNLPGFIYALSSNGAKLTLWRMRPNGSELMQLAANLPVLTHMLPAKGFVLADTSDGIARITASGVETLKLPNVQWRGILDDEPDRAYLIAGGKLYTVTATGDPQATGVGVARVFGGYEYILMAGDEADKSVVYLLKAGMNGKPRELASAPKNGKWALGSNLLSHAQKYAVLVRGEPSGAYTSYVIDLTALKVTTVADTFISQVDELRGLGFKPFTNKPGRILSLQAPGEAGKPLDPGNSLWTQLDQTAFDVNYSAYTGLAGMTTWADGGKGAMSSYAFFPDQEKVVRVSDGVPQSDAIWKNRVDGEVLQVHVLGTGALEAQTVTATSSKPVTLPTGLTLSGDNSLNPAKSGFVGLFKQGEASEVGLITPIGYVTIGPEAMQLQVGFDPTGDYADLLYSTPKLPSTLYVVRTSDGKAWTVMKNAVLAYWANY